MGVESEEEDPFSFPLDSNSISDLFAAEPDRIPFPAADDHLGSNSSLRRNVNSILFELSSRFAADADPLATYVAAGYADRFLSERETQEEEVWMAPLLAIACLSLAFKMKKIDLPLSGIHIGDGIAFDAVTIRRTEVMILIALDWQMRSPTPFSFFPFFLSLLPLDDDEARTTVRSGASEIILNSLRGKETKVMEFKASVIAASALLRALAIYEEELRQCCEAMGQLCCEKISSSSSTTTTTTSRSGTETSVIGDRCRHGSAGDGVVESSTEGAHAADSCKTSSNGER